METVGKKPKKGKKPNQAQIDKFTWKPGDITITPGPKAKAKKGAKKDK